MLWDLKPGEQLTTEDIEKAMKDPDIRPSPLHNLEKTSKPSVQLYFGPGFEERLELEMDEYVFFFHMNPLCSVTRTHRALLLPP